MSSIDSANLFQAQENGNGMAYLYFLRHIFYQPQRGWVMCYFELLVLSKLVLGGTVKDYEEPG